MNVSDMPAGPQGQQGPAGSWPPLPPYPHYLHGLKRPPAPRPVHVAVALMYAGLVCTVINLIISVATSGALKEAAQGADPAIPRDQVNGLVGIYVVAAVIIGLISAGLWLWMALANKYGQSWARIASTVLFGVYTLAALAGSLVRVTLTAPNGHNIEVRAPIAGELTTWLIWLAGLATIIALWQRQSSAYYDAVKQHSPRNLVGQYSPYAPHTAYAPYTGQQPGGAVAGPSGYGYAPDGPPWYGAAPAGPAQPPPPAVREAAPQTQVATPPQPTQVAPPPPRL